MAQRKFLVVMDEIKASSPEVLQPLKMLAEYLHQKNKHDAILAELENLMSGNIPDNSNLLLLVAATIYSIENNYEAAYKVLHISETIETMAFCVDLLLKINRLDAAKKKLKEMQELDEDATLTQLAQASVNVAIVRYLKSYFG